MNDDEPMLPSAGTEAEESPLRLLKIHYTIVQCKRSKRCTYSVLQSVCVFAMLLKKARY
jgi:hypothetical protein